MISPTANSLRVYLHLVAVAVWLGGQIVLAGIVPKLRKVAPEAMTTVARAFARIAWPAFIVIIFTGAWGLGTTHVGDKDTAYMVTLMVKMLLVGAAAIATIIHSVGTSKLAKGLGGALGLLCSLAAAYGGVLLAHAS